MALEAPDCEKPLCSIPSHLHPATPTPPQAGGSQLQSALPAALALPQLPILLVQDAKLYLTNVLGLETSPFSNKRASSHQLPAIFHLSEFRDKQLPATS